jgi:hypothetical protein
MPLAGVLKVGRVELAHHVSIVAAAQVPDRHRAGVDHHRHLPRLQAPGVSRGPVEDALDALDLHEVIAPADAADLRIPAQPVVRSHEVVQAEHPARLQAAALLHPGQVALEIRLMEQ